MELTEEDYRRAAIAYEVYRKQTASGDILPSFGALRSEIKDAWAAAIALLDAEGF